MHYDATEAAQVAYFAEQMPPVITTPEELAAQGAMPQIPYEKLERVPEGWRRTLDRAVRTLKVGQPDLTERNLTLERGRTWADTDDPDRPQTVTDRLALYGAAPGEGGDATRWLIVHELVGRFAESGTSIEDRAAALKAFEVYAAALDKATRTTGGTDE